MGFEGHPPEQVEEALTELVAAHGNSAEASRRLKARGVTIAANTLNGWRSGEHRDRYLVLEKTVGDALEQETVSRLRANIVRAAELETEMLEEAGKARGQDAPQALKAIADSKAKNIDKVLSLTGRPAAPRAETNDWQMIEAMVAKGYLTLKGGLELAPAPPTINSDAEEESQVLPEG